MAGIEKFGLSPKQVEEKKKSFTPKRVSFFYPDNLAQELDKKAVREAILITGHMLTLFDENDWLEYEECRVIEFIRRAQSRLLERYREIIETPYEKFYTHKGEF